MQQKFDAIHTYIAALKSDKSLVRQRAAWDIGMLGTGGRLAGPHLISALSDSDEVVRRRALWAIKEIGLKPECTELLFEALKTGDDATREAVVEILAKGLTNATNAPLSVLQLLIEIARLSDRVGMRRDAVTCLGKLGKPALPTLIDLLEDTEVRSEAIWSIGRIGVDAEEAVPALFGVLEEILEGPYCWNFFDGISFTFKRIGKPAVSQLIAYLHNRSRFASHSMMIRLLGNLYETRQYGEQIIKVLISALEWADDSSEGMEQNNKPQTQSLFSAQEWEEDSTRKSISRALATILEEDISAHTFLISALNSDNSAVRSGAAEALGHFGTLVCHGVFKQYRGRLRTRYALRAEHGIGDNVLSTPLNNNAAEVSWSLSFWLDSILKGVDDDLLHKIERTFQEVAVEDDAPLPPLHAILEEEAKVQSTLVTLLRDVSPELREQVIQVFRPIGAETETVVNALITALHDKDDRVRHSAAQSIREFGTLVDETLMP